ncbi:MAG TPA: hypothetical protein VFO76_09945 [Candidatus Kapabacteria bacterium]|nr:hypothetical protein [Candidatus Kapabacteria bacterium]
MKPTTDSGLLIPLTDGKIIMGLYPVIYGWRIRAGKAGEQTYFCDWCCGDDPKVVWGTYDIMKKLLEEYEITVLPSASAIKPWTRDPQFIARIGELLHGEEVTPMGVDRPSLQELRREYYERLQ